MNRISQNNSTLPGSRSALAQHDCQDALAHLLPANLRQTMEDRFPTLWKRRPHLLHLAITEAAGLAELTGFPDLFFPALALEKVEGVARWNCRQQRSLDRARDEVDSLVTCAC